MRFLGKVTGFSVAYVTVICTSILESAARLGPIEAFGEGYREGHERGRARAESRLHGVLVMPGCPDSGLTLS
jgi:hypothetical protein